MSTFSIVITTTRPRLLSMAVHSALAQDYEDFELVISDNSDEGCRGLVERFGDSRIKYVRPAEYMNVVSHWNFAFSYATGDWQTLLCDDHVFVPRLLSTLRRKIDNYPGVDTFFWKVSTFFDGEWHVEKERFRFLLPEFTGQTKVLDTKQMIEEAFASGTGLAGQVKAKVPLIPRAIYSREIIEKIRGRFGGSLFEPICPMTSAALAALALSPETIQIDLPMNVQGTPNDSAAAHVADSSTYIRMNQSSRFRHSPLKSMRVFPAIAAETTLHVRELMPDRFGHLDLNWINFFATCWKAIDELEELGADVTSERILYEEALSGFPPVVKCQVEKFLACPAQPSMLSRGIGFARNIAQRLLRVVWKGSEFSRALDTRKYGLNDILDCATFLDRRIAPHAG